MNDEDKPGQMGLARRARHKPPEERTAEEQEAIEAAEKAFKSNPGSAFRSIQNNLDGGTRIRAAITKRGQAETVLPVPNFEDSLRAMEEQRVEAAEQDHKDRLWANWQFWIVASISFLALVVAIVTLVVTVRGS